MNSQTKRHLGWRPEGSQALENFYPHGMGVHPPHTHLPCGFIHQFRSPLNLPVERFYTELHLQPPSSPPQRLLGGWKFQPSRSSWWPVHAEAVSIPHCKSSPQHKLRCGQKDPLWGLKDFNQSENSKDSRNTAPGIRDQDPIYFLYHRRESIPD